MILAKCDPERDKRVETRQTQRFSKGQTQSKVISSIALFPQLVLLLDLV